HHLKPATLPDNQWGAERGQPVLRDDGNRWKREILRSIFSSRIFALLGRSETLTAEERSSVMTDIEKFRKQGFLDDLKAVLTDSERATLDEIERAESGTNVTMPRDAEPPAEAETPLT